MKRTIIILCALLAACDVGDATSGNNPGTDGGTMSDGGGGGGDASGAACTNGSMTPSPAYAHTGAAIVNAADPTNTGQNCLQANCHVANSALGAPQYFAGGTVYTDAAGTTGAAGAYVKLGTMHTYADDHGNFYFTSDPGFPIAANEALVDATCPTQSIMVEATATGQCTSSACHGSGATGGYVHL